MEHPHILLLDEPANYLDILSVDTLATAIREFPGGVVIGNVYRMLDRYNDAVEVGKQVIVIFKKIGDQRGEANSLCNLGRAYRALGRQEAVRVTRESLIISQSMGLQHEVNACRALLRSLGVDL